MSAIRGIRIKSNNMTKSSCGLPLERDGDVILPSPVAAAVVVVAAAVAAAAQVLKLGIHSLRQLHCGFCRHCHTCMGLHLAFMHKICGEIILTRKRLVYCRPNYFATFWGIIEG